MPDGWIIDAEGNPTNDPATLYARPPGAILPFGGVVAHKGYGLSLVIEILSGALSGAGVCRPGPTRMGNGMFLECFRIDALQEPEEFYRDVETLIAHVKHTPTQPGFDEILLPGEPELRTRAQRLKDGIYVEDETWSQICQAAEAVGYPIAITETKGETD